MTEQDTQDEPRDDYESCGHDDREQRPVCTTDGEIADLCDECYGERRDAAELDFERDAEVFGYAN